MTFLSNFLITISGGHEQAMAVIQKIKDIAAKTTGWLYNPCQSVSGWERASSKTSSIGGHVDVIGPDRAQAIFNFSNKGNETVAYIRANGFYYLRSLPETPYFEVKFDINAEKAQKKGNITLSVGFTEELALSEPPKKIGHQQNSYGLKSDGSMIHNDQILAEPDPLRSYSFGDVIGCGLRTDSFHQWRVFFTINGRFIDTAIYFSSVPDNMKFYPAVSAGSGCPAAETELMVQLNSSGPFCWSVDENLFREHSRRANYFETLPDEIVGVIFGFAASSPLKVTQAIGTVCRKFNDIASADTIWRILYYERWPNQNGKLAVRNWKRFFKRRFEVENTSSHDQTQEIENCSFEYRCPINWQYLLRMDGKSENDERYCDRCNRSVYAVRDKKELKKRYELGQCVAVVTTNHLLYPERDYLIGIL